MLCAGVLNAAQTIVLILWPEQLQKTGKGWASQPLNRHWGHLKDVFDHALRRGMGMAQGAAQAVAAEEQWHALACTVQLAIHCLGIAYCSTQVRSLRACLGLSKCWQCRLASLWCLGGAAPLILLRWLQPSSVSSVRPFNHLRCLLFRPRSMGFWAP